MRRFDLIIVLGSQIGLDQKGEMSLAPHTEMKARAAGTAWRLDMARGFIVSGGYNIEVRYGLELKNPVYNGKPGSEKEPDFSEQAKKQARIYRSEASVMAEFLRSEYQVPSWQMILEEDSSTTQENAERCCEILEDMFWELAGSKKARIGVIALLYHMKRALRAFENIPMESSVSDIVSFFPLFAENLLARAGSDWIEKICQYYSTPKGGKQWNVEKIRQLLTDGKSLSSLIS